MSHTQTECDNSQIGVQAWEARRKAWRTPSDTGQEQSDADALNKFKDMQPKHFSQLYEELVKNRRPLKAPLPLPILLKAIVQGWKEEGAIPATFESILEKRLAQESDLPESSH